VCIRVSKFLLESTEPPLRNIVPISNAIALGTAATYLDLFPI
jgi:hypothetical protein